VRAKFVVYSETRDSYGSVTYKARPVTGETEENKAFFRTTPAGEISVTVKRDETAASLELGTEYYVDFTEAT
jgi:hypothetical protein